jgi:hypothetical protein
VGRLHLAGLSTGGLISLVLAAEVEAATTTTINSRLLVRNKTLMPHRSFGSS